MYVGGRGSGRGVMFARLCRCLSVDIVNMTVY